MEIGQKIFGGRKNKNVDMVKVDYMQKRISSLGRQEYCEYKDVKIVKVVKVD